MITSGRFRSMSTKLLWLTCCLIFGFLVVTQLLPSTLVTERTGGLSASLANEDYEDYDETEPASLLEDAVEAAKLGKIRKSPRRLPLPPVHAISSTPKDLFLDLLSGKPSEVKYPKAKHAFVNHLELYPDDATEAWKRFHNGIVSNFCKTKSLSYRCLHFLFTDQVSFVRSN